MSRILAIETATEACSAALMVDGEIRERLELARNRHGQVLIPMVRALLEQGNLELHSCDALAFGSGPGSFTGLRIGVAVAQGLAFGAAIPVIPVSSLWALSMRVGHGRVLAAIDARMNQVYWSLFEYDTGSGLMRPLQASRVSDPGEVVLDPAHAWTAVGSGCDHYRERVLGANLDAGIRIIPKVFPHAADIAAIAAREFDRGGGIDPTLAIPEYVRDQVVQAK